MNKIFLIIQREYLVRVRNKTFILMTFLSPLLFAALFILPIVLATTGTSEKVISVLDENNLFFDKLKGNKQIIFEKSQTNNLENARKQFVDSKKYALLYIPKLDLEKPKGIQIFSEKGLSMEVETQVRNKVSDAIEYVKIIQLGIDKNVLDKVKTSIDLDSRKITGEESNSLLLFGIGFGGSFLIYMSVFLYGTMVMRGVVEEKSNKIIEVIVSSIKPFQLMLGKILGVALVGLTQFAMWIVLTLALVTVITPFLGAEKIMQEQVKQSTSQMNEKQVKETEKRMKELTEKSSSMLNNIPITKFLVTYILYFLFAYLMYSALFAAAASAVDTEVEAQQFTTPISMPLILAIILGQLILKEPNGAIAFWGSMFPLTSPVIMMLRLPFDVPIWQIAISLFILILSFIGAVWLAGRIYRVGILTHGEKITYKKLYQWLFLKL
jgi:ABC-2 type transport system permease protein